ncbi:MAG: hypothetical protein KAI17_28155, partial [Thiotrichaceae bacterium]|nr:hypothetical protein [Thiotrichaceae bacterium]
KMPTPAPECQSPSMEKDSIHGPITASAHVIRLFKNKAPASKVREYLGEHVFLIDTTALTANTTDHFKK